MIADKPLEPLPRRTFEAMAPLELELAIDGAVNECIRDSEHSLGGRHSYPQQRQSKVVGRKPLCG